MADPSRTPTQARKPAAEIELITFLAELRRQIEVSQAAMRESGRSAMFAITDVELEAKLVVKADAKAQGGIKIFCLALGASAGGSAESVHTLKLKIVPLDQNGKITRLSAAADAPRPSLPDLPPAPVPRR